MKKLVGVLVFAIFAAQCTNSVSLRRRREVKEEEKDTGVMDMMERGLGMIEAVPLVGRLVRFLVEWILGTFNAIQDVTNGGFARVLGGTMPCTVSLDTGLRCTGISDKNSIIKLVMEILDQSPMPNFLKSIIQTLLDSSVGPIFDTVFGGLTTSSR